MSSVEYEHKSRVEGRGKPLSLCVTFFLRSIFVLFFVSAEIQAGLGHVQGHVPFLSCRTIILLQYA